MMKFLKYFDSRNWTWLHPKPQGGHFSFKHYEVRLNEMSAQITEAKNREANERTATTIKLQPGLREV